MRAGVAKDVEHWATLIALGARRARVAPPVEADESLRLVPVPVDTLRLSVAAATVPEDSREPDPSSAPVAARPPPEPPPHPEEAILDEDAAPLPAAMVEWRRAAESSVRWRAGTHGPVDWPFADEPPVPPAECVFVPCGAVAYMACPAWDVDARAFVARKTADEVRTGAVVPVTHWSQVRLLCPLFVVEHPSTGKKRIIFDARALNALLRVASGSVRYESVRDALTAVAGVATKLDVQSAFRHVRLSDRASLYLGFVVERRAYRYATLPFGVSWSPALFMAALQPAVDTMRRLGCAIVWYVDDFAVFAPTRAALDSSVACVLRTLREFGWQPAPEKVHPYAYRVLPFLGLLVDMRDPSGTRLRVPESKAGRIVDEAESALDAGRVSVDGLRRICGRMEFLRLVVPEVGLLRRPIDAALADAARVACPWVRVRGTALAHVLAVVVGEARSWPARSTPPGGAVAAGDRVLRVYSDASHFGWGALLAVPGGPFRPPRDLWHPPLIVPGGGFADAFGYTAGGWFSDADVVLSSAAREIRAMSYAILALDLHNATLHWSSDATAAVGAVRRWRSPSNGVYEALCELFEIVRERSLNLQVTHVMRECDLMPVADFLSRRGWREAQAEWAVPQPAIDSIVAWVSPPGTSLTADLFASLRNARREVYGSLWLEPGSIGDAFALPRDVLAAPGRVWWVFPPFSLIERFALHVRALARRAHSAASSSSPSSLIFTGILLLPPFSCLTASAWSVFQDLQRLALAWRSLVVWRPGGRRCLLPGLRLLGDGLEPAPGPPRRPLSATFLRVRI